MGDLLEDIRKAAVCVTSESGAVVVTQTGFRGPEVEINLGKLSRHDEYTLAEEIELTITSTRDARAEELQSLANQHELGAQSNGIAEHMLPSSSELDEIVGIGSSRQGHVEVWAYSDGDFVIQFHRNAVRRTDVANAALAPEVNEAIAIAMHAVTNQVRQLLRQQAGY